MTNRQRAAAETRKRLLDTTGKLVADKGFDNVSVDDIVRSCGVARGTFYVHFRNKAHAVHEYTRQPFQALRSAVETMDAPVLERAAVFMKKFTVQATSFGVGITQQWIREVIDPRSSPEAADSEKLAYDLEAIESLVAQAMGKGELREDTPVHEIAWQIACFLYGLLTCWCMCSGNLDTQALCDAYCTSQLPALIGPFVCSDTGTEQQL